MHTKIRWHHWLLTLLISAICSILIIGYGWSAFATITERPGLNGGMFSYYNLTRLQFTIYNGIVSVAGLYTICCATFFLLKKDKPSLTKTFRQFLIFIFLLIICEIYLQTRFVGKG